MIFILKRNAQIRAKKAIKEIRRQKLLRKNKAYLWGDVYFR